jgi:predicted nucleic acid-binding protein
MASVLVDTNILVDLYTEDVNWEDRSAAALASAADASPLVINPIIYAELSIRFAKIEELDQFLGTDFRRDPLPWQAGFVAGKAFLAYRKRGGQKTSPLPDFYIGAHAAVEGMTILTRDSQRFVTYFPSVKLLVP